MKKINDIDIDKIELIFVEMYMDYKFWTIDMADAKSIGKIDFKENVEPKLMLIQDLIDTIKEIQDEK